MPSPLVPPPFTMLSRLYADPEMNAVWSEENTIEGFLRAERALARAQARLGIIRPEDAEAIEAAAVIDNIDREALWAGMHNVGYPILPLIRMIDARLPEASKGRVHYGATTQDIMDTALSLQLVAATQLLRRRLRELGHELARHTNEHRASVMPGRTHAHHAVPTTFGAKLAGYLEELARHDERAAALLERAEVVSLHGAGGTAAALGPQSGKTRALMAEELGLKTCDVPWHVARDVLAEFGQLCAMTAATCGRFAHEVIDLSRTEIGEAHEAGGHHRGASSTMPQKVNPIGSEAIIGLAGVAEALSSGLYSIMQPGHERAAGEWQIEWDLLPQIAVMAAGALKVTIETAQTLRVFPERMRANLDIEDGLIMAEGYMMLLAPMLGQASAHDLIYEAATRARSEGRTLREVVPELVPERLREKIMPRLPLEPESYVGEAEAICAAALTRWAALVPLD